MKNNTVDARGKLCPVPLIMTKEVYDILDEGEQLITLVDNDTSAKNVETFILESGGKTITSRDGNLITISITKGKEAVSKVAEEYCQVSLPHVIFITANMIGNDEELGKALMQSFIQTIKDVVPLPSHIILINTGVMILETGTKTAEALVELESLNVKVVACGTCLDYYGIMDKRAGGQVSNMYDILSILTNADKIIKP